MCVCPSNRLSHFDSVLRVYRPCVSVCPSICPSNRLSQFANASRSTQSQTDTTPPQACCPQWLTVRGQERLLSLSLVLLRVAIHPFYQLWEVYDPFYHTKTLACWTLQSQQY